MTSTMPRERNKKKKNKKEMHNILARACHFFSPHRAPQCGRHTRLQNDNSVYISDEKPSWDNVIALIIRRGCNGYHCLLHRLSIRATPIQPQVARPIIRTNTAVSYIFFPLPLCPLGTVSAPLKCNNCRPHSHGHP